MYTLNTIFAFAVVLVLIAIFHNSLTPVMWVLIFNVFLTIVTKETAHDIYRILDHKQ